jgi:hypothetical protein
MHIVIIDLDDPHVRFEMVMADDVTSVDTTRRERIEDIVSRPPYENQDTVVAINADYFGIRHGPEGLTVKNGQRLDDGDGESQNPNALWRSSLAISRLNRISLGRKTADELNNPRAYRERFYNAIGGGPLILNYGVVIPNIVSCMLEGFPLGACRRRIQTAAGLSEDGRWLYLAVGEGRDIQGFARLLKDYGAYTAIKLDGGGSSQLWYDGEMRHETDRPVGNALLVFISPVPRHDAEIEPDTNFTVVEPGERAELGFEILNTGFLDWDPDLGYRFRNVQGWPVLGPAYYRLPQTIPSDGSLLLAWDTATPVHPGIYEAEWQLVRRTEPIGPRFRFGVVVVPRGSGATGFKAHIETRLNALRSRAGFERDWPQIRSELEREIWNEVKSELRAALSAENGRASASAEAVIRAQWLPLLRHLAW